MLGRLRAAAALGLELVPAAIFLLAVTSPVWILATHSFEWAVAVGLSVLILQPRLEFQL